MLPVDTFVIVFFLFQLKDMLHEKLLQIFIGIVDAKLLEAIVTEIFKAEYIQYTYGASGHVLGPIDRFVYLFHDMYEQSSVYSLDERVSDIHRLVPGQRRHLRAHVTIRLNKRKVFSTVIVAV